MEVKCHYLLGLQQLSGPRQHSQRDHLGQGNKLQQKSVVKSGLCQIFVSIEQWTLIFQHKNQHTFNRCHKSFIEQIWLIAESQNSSEMRSLTEFCHKWMQTTLECWMPGSLVIEVNLEWGCETYYCPNDFQFGMDITFFLRGGFTWLSTALTLQNSRFEAETPVHAQTWWRSVHSWTR